MRSALCGPYGAPNSEIDLEMQITHGGQWYGNLMLGRLTYTMSQ